MTHVNATGEATTGADLIYDWNVQELPPRQGAAPSLVDLTPASLSPSSLPGYLASLPTWLDRCWLGVWPHSGEDAQGDFALRLQALEQAHWPGEVWIDTPPLPLGQGATLPATCSPEISWGLVLDGSRLFHARSGAPILGHAALYQAELELALDITGGSRARARLVVRDAARAYPSDLAAMVRGALASGITRVCLSDDSGAADPQSVQGLIRFVRQCGEAQGVSLELEWRGCNQRDLAVANTLEAVGQGVARVHASMLGLGLQSGYTSLDQLLVNLVLDGLLGHPLNWLANAVETVASLVGQEVPVNYPIFGHDAFRTATGVHAAALVKAQLKGDTWLEDCVYSGVPASMIGRHQLIDVGPMSGESNVVAWLRHRKMEPRPEWVTPILQAAKASKHTLSEAEVCAVLQAVAGDEVVSHLALQKPG